MLQLHPGNRKDRTRNLVSSETKLRLVSQNLETKFPKDGFSVIEILILITVLVSVMGVFIGFASFSLQSSIAYKQTAQANALLQEAMEATRNFRDAVAWNDGLGVMATGIAYYPKKSADNPPKWQMLQGQETIGIFTRSVTFANGQRDGQSNVVESGGTPDPNTKKVTAQVSWSEHSRSHSVSLVSYLTNWKQ